MKKLYALSLAVVSTAAMAQVSVNDIAGKYRLVSGCEPTYYIEDHGFYTDNIVLIDKTGDKTFALDNFFYNMTNYDSEPVVLNGTFQDAGEWSNYPTVQNIQFTWDNTDLYFYNPEGETEDTQWFFLTKNSMRLVTTKTESGNTMLSLWPNNEAVFTYYTEANGYNNLAVGFANVGAWAEGKLGSMQLERLPQYTTVSKRALADTYTVSGVDADGKPVSYVVEITSEGGESYSMTGLMGCNEPISFTWDDNDAGIRANYTESLSSYAPNYNIYISFTEEGNLAFDFDLIYVNGEETTYLFNAVATKGVTLTGTVGTAWFVDGNSYDYLPYDSIPVPYTMGDKEIVLTNFLNTGVDLHVDINVEPYVEGDYSYYYPNFTGEGVTSDEKYFYVGSADAIEAGQETIINGFYTAYCFYEPSEQWLEICYYSDNSHKWNYLDIFLTEQWTGEIQSIKQVAGAQQGVQFFDLQGRRTNKLSGLGIKVENGKCTKILVK